MSTKKELKKADQINKKNGGIQNGKLEPNYHENTDTKSIIEKVPFQSQKSEISKIYEGSEPVTINREIGKTMNRKIGDGLDIIIDNIVKDRDSKI